MTRVDMSQFRPLKFDFGKIHISGGHSTKPLPVTSTTITSRSGENITFVKLSTRENWLVHCTTGFCKTSVSAFGRTSLLGEMREELRKHCDGLVEYTEGHAEGAGKDDDDYDPMADIEADSAVADGASRTVGRGVKRMRYYKNHGTKTVVVFPMPVRCKEEDPDCTEYRTIRMYIADRKQLWLDMADLDWAMKYLYVQHHLKGVPLVADDSTGPGSTH